MRYEPDGGFRLVGIGFKRGKHIAIIVNGGVGQTDIFQFIDQIASKHHLSGRTRRGAGIFVGCGFECHIFQKTIYNIHTIKKI